MIILTPDIAAGFARSTLGHVGREYPYKLDQVLTGPADLASPSRRHPIFHGSYDWHSCVHGWWQLLTIARLFPELPEAEKIRARADAMLTTEKAAGELATLERSSMTFERPYGWAWALALHREAARHDSPWAVAIEPLALAFAERFRAHLPKLTYPIRSGAHANTAFALVLTLDWAETHDRALADLCRERAKAWFDGDRDCQAWEPGGDEFLSASLCEALLMTRVVEGGFASWFDAFLPRAAEGVPATLFAPATVSDRSDGKIAHLDGVNLSRAWCWRGIASRLGEGHPAHTIMRDTAERHIAASLPHITDDYMGEHWLASFALLALHGE
jgi:hypothetical protein